MELGNQRMIQIISSEKKSRTGVYKDILADNKQMKFSGMNISFIYRNNGTSLEN